MGLYKRLGPENWRVHIYEGLMPKNRHCLIF